MRSRARAGTLVSSTGRRCFIVKRIRWALVVLGAAAVVGAGSAAVFARSAATYTNHAIAASDFHSYGTAVAPGYTGSKWLNYGERATWTFGVAGLQTAASGTVNLNFAALSAGPYWGAGFSSSIRVVVTGAVKGTFTTMLANPWRPHIAFNDTPGVGWNAATTLAVPRAQYAGATALTVTVELLTAGNHIGMEKGSLAIGYASVS
jgi:hypothetical protein